MSEQEKGAWRQPSAGEGIKLNTRILHHRPNSASLFHRCAGCFRILAEPKPDSSAWCFACVAKVIRGGSK